MKQIPMTIRGAQKLREELDFLKNITRPKIIADITEARKHGDLKENAEYHSIREQQSFCETRIKDIEMKLSYAQIIDIKKINNIDYVTFGATVTVLNLINNEKQTYCIVGDDEANIKENLISINSPIARGLIRKKINDISIINTPKGPVKYKILQIRFI